MLYKRQSGGSSASSGGGSPPPAPTPPPNSNPPPPNTPPPPPPSSSNNSPSSPNSPTQTTNSPQSSSSSGSSSGSTTSSASVTTPTGPPPLDTGTTIPPLANITMGMATKAPPPFTLTYKAGATPPISGVPVLPTPFVRTGDWPDRDKVPPTDSSEVAEWMKELDGHDIPNLSVTKDGSCPSDTAAAADAANRGWWTCGGPARVTDIVACPDKNTWGISFDDGPAFYSHVLLNYLKQKNLDATFFVVGSRVYEHWDMLVDEYMNGHEISVHTWSHRPLTSLTNEQIVAELGWTRKIIKQVLGVTPTTMRPPYGDIDDRVRAISLAMGMIPVLWTQTPSGTKFDTNDWRVAGGTVNGTSSFNTFESILSSAATLDTGFIVLEHDLFEITVDLAVGYFLDAALSHQPKFNLEPIGQCSHIPTTDLYLESNQNETFPYASSRDVDVSGDGSVDTKSGDGGKTAASASTSAGFPVVVPFMSPVILLSIGLLSALF
ncbi:hypothetical protein CPB83DRAFT_772230 [Crepidotus variabilis]|uniref:chitin deacetylase n=1 Tax=Crepidotus variabilis TaxID=179855 RepID=A0A9P6EA42_9AGAR|nr:hypothetical protein CPB83DRAFT_772230 [Crepidotus variabilis]